MFVAFVPFAREVRAADAVFDAEFWQSAADIERINDLDACEDAGQGLRRAIRSTAATNVVAYELRVGDIADAGAYEMWARLRIPESSTRTILVGQDVGGSFTSPQDSFVVQSGAGESGYRWLRLTRQGSGTADNPEEDPWQITLTESPSMVELRLEDTDIAIDRFAVSNAGAYTPPSCPPYVPTDGGSSSGDADRITGAQEVGCQRPAYYDLQSNECVTPSEHGCAAAPGCLGCAGLMLLLRRRR